MRRSWYWLSILSIAGCSDEDGYTSAQSGSGRVDAGAEMGSRDQPRKDAGRDDDDDDDDDDDEDQSGPLAQPRADAGEQLCQSIKIQSGRVTPDMLIVLDRSSSMRNQGVNRWDPSVSGLKAITAALDDTVNFGLMAFPGAGGLTGGQGRQCAPGSVEVEVGPRNAAAIATRLDTLQLVESTPTAATLMAAHEALKKLEPPADGAAPRRFVVLVTDGAPNCTNGQLGGRGGGSDGQAVMASVQAIATMAKEDIETYVVGYDTQTDPELKSALDAMAMAGGTGDAEHRAIEDERELISAFQEIAKTVVSCEFRLAEAPADPSYVEVQIGGTLIRYDDADGWVLSADKRTLILQGGACGMISQPNATLSVEVQCEQVQYL